MWTIRTEVTWMSGRTLTPGARSVPGHAGKNVRAVAWAII